MAKPEVCRECPFLATLAAAEKVSEQFDEFVRRREVNSGVIALTRLCLIETAQIIDCPGPVTGNGQLDCPIRESATGARTYAAANWELNIDLDRLGRQQLGKSSHDTGGQYL